MNTSNTDAASINKGPSVSGDVIHGGIFLGANSGFDPMWWNKPVTAGGSTNWIIAGVVAFFALVILILVT